MDFSPFAFCFATPQGETTIERMDTKMKQNKKNHIKYWAIVVIGVALVVGITMLTVDYRLKASEDDGSVTASEQQEAVARQSEPVEIFIPAKELEAEEVSEILLEEEGESASEIEIGALEEKHQEEYIDENAPDEEEEEVVGTDPSVRVRMLNKGDLYYGDTIKLQAVVRNMSGDYSLQWQSNDGSGWQDISGETGSIYAFTVTEDSPRDYRVVLHD